MNFRFLLRRILLPFIGLVGLFMVIIFTINASIFDEELIPEVSKIMQPQSLPAKQGNAYYAIWGLSAENSKNILDSGYQLVERYQRNLNDLQKDELSDADYQSILGSRNLDDDWQKQWQFCIARSSQQCVISLAEQLIDGPQFSQRLSLMLERYNQIIQMPNYQHAAHVTFNTPLPPYGALVKLRQIQLAQAFNQSTKHGFIDVLAKDLKFWKMLLRDGDTLIDKMIAVASIWGDLQALSDYIASNSLTESQRNSIENILSGLTKQELDISESFIFEAKAFYMSLATVDASELGYMLDLKAWPILWLTQYNATQNMHYQKAIKPNLALAKMPVDAFYNAVANNKINAIDFNYSIASLYNLGGKMYLQAGAINYHDYIARVHDLNGMFDLVKLQLELKNSSDETTETTINNSKIKNPYTKEPFNYNPKDKTLSFKCLDKGSLCQISF